MKQTLYDPLPYETEYGGRSYTLTPYFNRILAVFDLHQRSDLMEEDKLKLSLFLLVKKSGTVPDPAGLFNHVIGMLIEPRKQKSEKKYVDYIQDSAYIYAAFRQAYGIDLFAEQDRMHWWQFLSLFQGLPENTRIMQIISIRSKPIPKATRYNRDEINQLIQLKAEYALEVSQEERERQYAEGLKKIAKALGA